MAHASSPEQVMACSGHSAQSNGFLQTAGKGAAPTAHRGVSVPMGSFPSQMQMKAPEIFPLSKIRGFRWEESSLELV